MNIGTLFAPGMGCNLLTWQVDKKIPGGMNLQPPLEMDAKQTPQKIPTYPKQAPVDTQQTPSPEGPRKDPLLIF